MSNDYHMKDIRVLRRLLLFVHNKGSTAAQDMAQRAESPICASSCVNSTIPNALLKTQESVERCRRCGGAAASRTTCRRRRHCLIAVSAAKRRTACARMNSVGRPHREWKLLAELLQSLDALLVAHGLLPERLNFSGLLAHGKRMRQISLGMCD